MYKSKVFSILVLLVFCACVPKVQYKPLSVPENKIVFPAVHKVVTDDKIGFSKVNLLKGIYVTNYVHKHDLLTKIRFRLVFRTTRKLVDVAIRDMQRYDSDLEVWKKDEVTLAFDGNKLRNNLLARIDAILGDAQVYKQARNDALKDFEFNIMGMSSMTEVAANRWIEKALLNRVFTWELPLNEFRETKWTPGEDRRYRYVASFLFEQSENLLEKVFGKGGEILIELYTNSDRYAKYNKGERIKARGILTGAVKLTDELYSFHFIDESLSN